MGRDLQLLGMAKKAGLLAIGTDAVGGAARSGKVRLVISASDASEGATRRARRNAENGKAAFATVPYTMAELGRMTGRGAPGTVAFLDAGLATAFLDALGDRRVSL
jgi:ribosomal protein L7Ae-like RNA K-turn-binding protein